MISDFVTLNCCDLGIVTWNCCDCLLCGCLLCGKCAVNNGGIKKNYRMGKCASARIRLTTQEAETESEKSEKHKALNGIMKGVREWLK